MPKDRYLDLSIKNIGRIPTIEISESSFSFNIEVGDFKKAEIEEENILLLEFENCELRIEMSIKELLQKLRR